MRNILIPTMARKPRIEVQLEETSNEFTTSDSIRGKVVIQSQVEAHFDAIEIKLEGCSKTFVDLMSALPGIQEISKASRTFLTLRQPGLELRYPLGRRLQRGMTYEFPFEFVLPKSLVDGSCGHETATPAIRDAHLILPPSFGRGTGGAVDSSVPETTVIEYGISATIFKSNKLNAEKNATTMASTWSDIVVIPCSDATLLLDTRKTQTGGARDDCRLRSAKSMSKGILRPSLGTITVEAARPDRLKLKRREEGVSHRFCTVPVNVNLRFDSTRRTTQVPEISKIASRLEVNTFYTTSSHKDLPRKDDALYDRNRRVYTKHLPSASVTPEKAVWETASAKHEDLYPEPTHLETANYERGLTAEPSPTPNGSSRVAKLLVPVSIPVPTDLVPSFHSCLISRTYILEMSIKLTSQGCNRSVNLRLPLQISADLGDRAVEFSAGDQTTTVSILPGYSDGVYAGQVNPVWSCGQQTAGDLERELVDRQLASLICDDPPPEYRM